MITQWRLLRNCAMIALLFITTACETPAKKIYRDAQALGLSPSVLQGKPFVHAVFFNQYYRLENTDTLHVYIEGDGSPYSSPGIAAKDPTPQNPLTLRLMAKDSLPAIYLGRPCYFGFATTPPCSDLYWTSYRYGQEVIDSMVAALQGFLGKNHQKKIVFFGHSGGGTLALLLAPYFKETKTVVTVGSNLDIDAWTVHHNYEPLAGSLNPSRRPPLSKSVFQLHMAGSRDANVPPQIIHAEVLRQTNGEVAVVENFDHVCCWEKAWPDLLKKYGLSEEKTRILR